MHTKQFYPSCSADITIHWLWLRKKSFAKEVIWFILAIVWHQLISSAEDRMQVKERERKKNHSKLRTEAYAKFLAPNSDVYQHHFSSSKKNLFFFLCVLLQVDRFLFFFRAWISCVIIFWNFKYALSIRRFVVTNFENSLSFFKWFHNVLLDRIRAIGHATEMQVNLILELNCW